MSSRKEIHSDVIVTYCWNRVGYNIIRSLHQKGLKVIIGDTSSKNICSVSRYCHGSFVYADPFTNETQFIKDVVEAILKYHPRVLMPTHDEGLVLAKHIDELPKDVVYAMEAYEKQYKLSDKLQSTLIASSAGIPIPEVIPHLNDVKNFPIVVKLKFSNSAKGVFFPNDFQEAQEICAEYSRDEYLLEEFFKGTDYSVDCVRWHDFFQASVYKALVTKTDGGGTTTQRVLVSMPQLEGYAKALLDKTDYNGVCGIDFRVNEQTDAAFIEVNTRFTGGLATPIAGGFDIPYILYSLVTTGKYDEAINIRIGTKTKWILGDFIALVTKIVNKTLKKWEFKQIMKWNFDAYDDFKCDDPQAIIGECLYYFIKLVKNRKLNP